jgi:hypothetical protein
MGRLSARIVQLWLPPATIAMAVPEVALTRSDGDDWPARSLPQQMTAPPLRAWIGR